MFTADTREFNVLNKRINISKIPAGTWQLRIQLHV